MRDPYVGNISIQRPNHLGGESWNLSGLNSVTVLFGKNGSGKSVLMRAWNQSDVDSVHYVVPERTGELSYQPNYLSHQLTGQQRRGQGERNFNTEYRRHVIARVQAYFAARGNVRGDRLPGDPGDLEKLLGQLVPDFEVELRGTGNPPYEFKRASTDQVISNINDISSGEAQLIMLGLDVLTIAGIWEVEGKDRRIVLIDEPDAHIHPDLQVRFADFLVAVAEKFKLQIVVATHSTTLMAALGQFGSEGTSVLYLDRTKSDFKAESFTSIMKELASCLGGHALMGPLFGVPMLLVEGDDDYRIWSQIPRHHKVNFAVLPSHGEEIKKYQRTLEKLFASLREEGSPLAGYALIDSDKGKPQPSEHHPQNHIKFIQLACHESENLYLCDEVLADLKIDWEDASRKIVEKAAEYGNKSEILSGAKEWNRKTQDIKDVINEVSKIIDTKNVHWTIRVAKAIGRARPSGQLEDFLGQEIIESLWTQEQ